MHAEIIERPAMLTQGESDAKYKTQANEEEKKSKNATFLLFNIDYKLEVEAPASTKYSHR